MFALALLLGVTFRAAEANGPPIAVATASLTTGKAPLTVYFDGTESSDPDGDTLVYARDLDGDGAFGDSFRAAVVHLHRGRQLPGSVANNRSQGASSIASVTITAGHSPTALIFAPVAGTAWKVGDVTTLVDCNNSLPYCPGPPSDERDV